MMNGMFGIEIRRALPNVIGETPLGLNGKLQRSCINSVGQRPMNLCVVSVNHRKVETVKNYIINQKTHHERRDFKMEFRAFLKHYQIEYDERYVWD